jgi:hypothetical protein
VRITIVKVSNGALVKTELNKDETDSEEHEKHQKVFGFDEEKPDGIIDMLQEIFDDVLFLGDSKYDKEGREFICNLVRVHGRKYDTSQCEAGCVLCLNTKIVKDFRDACREEKA